MKPDAIDLMVFNWVVNFIDTLPTPNFGNNLPYAGWYFKQIILMLSAGGSVWMVIIHYIHKKNTQLYGLSKKK